MMKRTSTILAAGIAAVVLATAPAATAQNNGNKDAKASKSEGNGNANRGNTDRENGKQDNSKRGNAGKSNESGQTTRAEVKRDSGNGRAPAPPAAKGKSNGNQTKRALSNNGNKANRAAVGQTVNRGNGDQADKVRSRDGIDLDIGFALPQLRQTLVRDTRVINGCPPGLAKKRNGCLPLGQAKKAYRNYDPGYFGLRGIGSGQYFYDDGYLLSYRGDGLTGYLPLLGGALGIGNIWPTTYQAKPLPSYYSNYYGLSDPRGYRFADNVIYRVDPETAAIASVAALLTGDDISIGRPLPAGYDVYNIPYSYRNQYADGPRANYRYGDGYIYEVDPETALVVAAIDLVT